jgi:hypothetical protein
VLIHANDTLDIADNIYNLLSSGHYQKSCNNITNNNSLLVPGFEKDLNRNVSNNRIETVKQRDDNTLTSSNVNTRLKILNPDITPELSTGLHIKDIVYVKYVFQPRNIARFD